MLIIIMLFLPSVGNSMRTCGKTFNLIELKLFSVFAKAGGQKYQYLDVLSRYRHAPKDFNCSQKKVILQSSDLEDTFRLYL